MKTSNTEVHSTNLEKHVNRLTEQLEGANQAITALQAEMNTLKKSCLAR